jgi:hypothetical protein
MTALTKEQALENIYTAMHNGNQDIDTHITALKTVLTAKGEKDIEVNPERLPQNNRQGRKMMQSYFKKRGINVNFPG